MTLSQSDLDALVELLSESLRAAAGKVLTESVITDRARNAAAVLDSTYEMRLLAAEEPHVWGPSTGIGTRRRCINCGVGEYYSARVGLDGGCKGKPPGSAS